MLLLVSATAFASSGKTYQLAELGMSIDIPTEYVVFTRDITDNDPNLSAYGLCKSDLLSLMKSRNIYLNAWDKDVNFEIIVTMIESKINDFNLMSDTVLNTLASSFKSAYIDRGITVEKYEIYQHDQAKFIKVYINQPNGADKVYGLQYYTVYDNKAINVTMQSYSGKINSDKETILKSIVSTVHFDKGPQMVESPTDTDDSEAFLYTDKDTGSTFTVPANWTQESLSAERAFLDIMFTSNKEPGLNILYGSTDMWSEIPSGMKKGVSRSDIDNSIFTADELAEIMGVDKESISIVTYGGKEYYQYTAAATSSTYGINLEVMVTGVVRIENGYVYMFLFSGDTQNAYYKAFESLIRSVKYPNTGSLFDFFS